MLQGNYSSFAKHSMDFQRKSKLVTIVYAMVDIDIVWRYMVKDTKQRKSSVLWKWSKRILFACIAVSSWMGYEIYSSYISYRLSYAELEQFTDDLKPLLDLIGKGEGTYTSVNRGKAGDTPNSWLKANMSMDLTDMTVEEVRTHQGGTDARCWYKGVKGTINLFAVGRYQLIPCTLQEATRNISDLDMQAKFSPKLQDVLGVYLVLVKRPKVTQYLIGWEEDSTVAGQALAKEFASFPVHIATKRCAVGQSFYCNDSAGNAAHVSIDAVQTALQQTRQNMQKENSLQRKIEKRETIMHRWKRSIVRWYKG